EGVVPRRSRGPAKRRVESGSRLCQHPRSTNRRNPMASRFMLCSFKTCPWVQRAAIVLQAKQVAYDITYIDRDNRPAWFLAVSPHSKGPVLQIDEKEALFESNAIAEYLDETAQPRLHPEDALQRARNRAWTDYVPTFASAISQTAYSNTEEDF